jgi:large conductance mechanosensitive channel
MSKKDPNKKGFFGEFKEFITRGNVLDMAVGVIIGGAFTAIVTALTAGILQPVINWILGMIFPGKGLEAARTILGEAFYTTDDLGEKVVDWSKTNYIDWGQFIGAVINFLLVALVLFIIIKAINNVHKAGQEAKAKLVEKAKGEEEKAEEKPEEK